MTNFRPAIFFGTFIGLIVLPWVVVYVTLGPGMFARQPVAPVAAKAPPAQCQQSADITTNVAGAKRARVTRFAGGTINEAQFADEAAAARYLESEFGAINLNEIRAPLRDTANHSGWRWKQLMLDAPWLTG